MIIPSFIPKDISCYFTEQAYSPKVLYTEEKKGIAKYEPKRLSEFCTGRYCAHKSLEKFYKKEPILKQSTGLPLWPKDIIGSISHSQKLTGAIVASSNTYLSIGLDIETIGRIDYDLWELLFTTNEIKLLKQQSILEHKYLSTLFFAMKEAFYKMQYPVYHIFMDFHDCEVIYKEEAYNLRVLKKEFKTKQINLKYKTNYSTYKDQVITWVTAIS